MKSTLLKRTFVAACSCLAIAGSTYAQGNLESYFSGATLAKGYKSLSNHNPLYTQRFGADPCAMIYKDDQGNDKEVYIYMTDDVLEYKNGSLIENSYGKIYNIDCVSSKDLVNWTDHGPMHVAGSGGTSKAGNSWAPTACYKKINGKERFFLYFANGGNGIYVVASDTPYGPWQDVKNGQGLITRSMPNCNVNWLFDPAVLVDDDGTGYIYFGGGVPDGKQADPGTARVAKLGKDFISIEGTAATIRPPYLFEDAGINKIGNKYIYSYCINWNTGGNPYGFSNAEIGYMTSSNPMGPFNFSGVAYANQGAFLSGQNGGNNHHSMFKFKGKWYMTYHARLLQNAMNICPGKNLNYRSSHVDYVTVNESTGVITKGRGSEKGVEQVGHLDPFEKTEAETMAWMGGIDTKYGGSNMLVTKIDKGDWTGVAGADFGQGATVFTACVSSTTKGAIKIVKGKPDGEVVGYLEVPNTNGQLKEVTTTLTKAISGVTDLFFVYSGGFDFDYWMFKKADVTLNVSETDVEAPATIAMSIKTSEQGITKADYYLGDKLIGSSTASPFDFKYDVTEVGQYEFHAILTNNAGKTFETPTATVKARLAQGPYEGVAQKIPGRVEAERYDVGGAGYAYEDASVENEGDAKFRTDEGVDVVINDGDGLALGYTAVGDWTEYTVDVEFDDEYTWAARIASGSTTSAFSIQIDDKDIAGGKISVPQTGENTWDVYQIIEGETSKLSAGKHVMKITIEGAYVNIDYISFKAKNHIDTGIEGVKAEPIQFTIYNMQGVEIGTVTASEFEVSSTLKNNGYAAGAYIVKAADKDSKVVIVK